MRQADHLIALAGNPNTGKSTVFNNLTGLTQHTGNWPGKTVELARGYYRWHGREFCLVDLPGTYSLWANSPDEAIAGDFICYGGAEVCVVVTDATCLERNLSLVLQIIEATSNVVVCLNFMDEAKLRKISVDVQALRDELGVEVVACSARRRQGMRELKEAVYRVATGEVMLNPTPTRYGDRLERGIERLLSVFSPPAGPINPRWSALMLLDGDEQLLESAADGTGMSVLRDTAKEVGTWPRRTPMDEKLLGWRMPK